MEKINKTILSISFVLDRRSYKFSIPIFDDRTEMEKKFTEYSKNNYLNAMFDEISGMFPKKKSSSQILTRDYY